nr:hypothetical protein [Tanacetum cinerariifolium]
GLLARECLHSTPPLDAYGQLRKSLGYKVFHAQKKSDNFLMTCLRVFCSERDDWSDCAEVYPAGLFVGFGVRRFTGTTLCSGSSLRIVTYAISTSVQF